MPARKPARRKTIESDEDEIIPRARGKRLRPEEEETKREETPQKRKLLKKEERSPEKGAAKSGSASKQHISGR